MNNQDQPQPTYFEVGQTVYSHLFPNGEGTVVEIGESLHPVMVQVHTTEERIPFTHDGRNFLIEGITLSSTPLTPIQNEPIREFKQGDLVWVRDLEHEAWQARYFCEEKGEVFYVFIKQNKSGKTARFNYCVPFHPIPF